MASASRALGFTVLSSPPHPPPIDQGFPSGMHSKDAGVGEVLNYLVPIIVVCLVITLFLLSPYGLQLSFQDPSD